MSAKHTVLGAVLGGLAVAAALTLDSSAFAAPPTLWWTTERIDAVAPDVVHWDWEEFGRKGASAWGWSPMEHDAPDGTRAGSWVAFPPRDFAAQILGPELIKQCEAEFARGATVCGVHTGDFDFSLGANGKFSLQIFPSALRVHVQENATLSSSRIIGNKLEWFGSPQEGYTTMSAELPK